MLIVFQGRRKADWCLLEYPRYAVRGEGLKIKLTVLEEVPKAKLKIDLHWLDKDNSGFFTYSRQSFEAFKGNEYVYEWPIKQPSPYEAVFPVVFLSPSGKWNDSLKQAAGQAIFLKDKLPVDFFMANLKERPFFMGYEETIEYQNPSMFRLFLEALLFSLALRLIVYLIILTQNNKAMVEVKALLFILAFVFLIIIVLRISGIDQRLAGFLRRIFHVNQVYHSRRIFQRLGLLSFAGAWLFFQFLVLRYHGFTFNLKLMLLFGALIVLLVFTRYISLHSVDAFYNRRFVAIPVYYGVEFLLFFGLYIAGILHGREIKKS